MSESSIDFDDVSKRLLERQDEIVNHVIARLTMNKEAKSLIKRVRFATENHAVDEIEMAKHMQRWYAKLGIKCPPIKVAKNLKQGFGAARGAAREAAREAARGAAREAAWDAARGAAHYIGAINSEIKDEEVTKYLEIEIELFKALENGLDVFFPMKDSLILVPAPILRVDEQQNLHAENQPAVEWPGEKYYFWHGVKITPKISKGEFGKKELISQRNTEIRRAMTEILGTDKFHEVMQPKALSQDNYGELYAVEQPDEPYVYVRVQDASTQRKYNLRVPPSYINKTPRQACAWTYNVAAKDYEPMVES